MTRKKPSDPERAARLAEIKQMLQRVVPAIGETLICPACGHDHRRRGLDPDGRVVVSDDPLYIWLGPANGDGSTPPGLARCRACNQQLDFYLDPTHT